MSDVHVECPECKLVFYPKGIAKESDAKAATERAEQAERDRDAAIGREQSERHMRQEADRAAERVRSAAQAQAAEAIAVADHAARIEDELKAVRKRLANALAALAMVQWPVELRGVPTCSVCGGHQRDVSEPDYDRTAGHNKGCAIARALEVQS